MAIRHADSQLFYNNTVHKDWYILIVEDNVTLRNEDILADELTIQESLCSDQDITLGSCEASTFEFKMFNKGFSLKGKKLRVSLVLNGHVNNPIPIGEYKVDEDTYEEDERIRKIKAYDALKDILEKDFAEWFNSLETHSMTCKTFRDSFFTAAGVQQETVNLINDQIPFTFQVTNSSQTQRMIEEENEIVEQRKKNAELGVILYDYTLIDLSTYDPTKKTHDVSYDQVTPQSGANPHTNGWYAIATKGRHVGEYVLTQDTEVKTYVTYEEVQPHEGDNPHDLGWWAMATRGAHKGEMVPTQDTTVQPDKKYYTRTEVQKAYFTRTESNYFNPYALGWYKFDIPTNQYVEATETVADELVNYFTRTEHPIPLPDYKEVVPYTGDNPHDLGWYEYDGTNYNLSTDQTVDQTKTYYEMCLPEDRSSAMLELNPDIHSRENPKTSGWYEFISAQNAYVKTEDTTITPNKKYYLNIWEINQNDRKDLIQDEIKGADIITAICEINGCFGHIGRDGVFHYIKLKPIDYEGEGLYPSPDLYPDPNLYPAGQPADWIIDRSKYETCEKGSYVVKKLDRLVICKEDGDAGYVYPAESASANHNTYKIQGNFIWYSFTESQDTLDIAGMNILTNGIAQISEYTPCSIDLMGNPCMEVGDTVKVITRLGTFWMYVTERTLTGSQRLKDTIKAKGNEKRQEENSLYNSVIELQGKSNVLTRNIDMTRSEIVDMGENLSSLIEQTAEAIRFEVSKEIKSTNDIVNEKYQSAIKLTQDQIALTVSKTLYDEMQKELEEWKSDLDVDYDSITAEVSHKVSETGGTESFSWRLLSTGFILSAQGGYNLVSTSATADLIDAQPVGTEDPYAEWWHESAGQGMYKLTTDRTVQSGKTYYKSRQNPHDLEWYELDTEHNSYSLTNDTCIHEYKSYYTQNTSSDPRPIFTANAGGVVIDGFLKTTMLDVKNIASFGLVRAVDAKVTNLEVEGTILANRIGTAEDRINTLYADYVSAQRIQSIVVSTTGLSASNITTGTMSVRHIDFVNGNMDMSNGSITGLSSLITGALTLNTLSRCVFRNNAGATSHVPQWQEKRVMGVDGNPTYIRYLGYTDGNSP